LQPHHHRTLHGYGGLALLLAVGTFGSVHGQNRDSEAFNVDLAQCIDLISDAERFACYQERVDDALAEREASRPVAAADASRVTAARPPPTQAAGESEPPPRRRGARDRRPAASAAVQPESLSNNASGGDEILTTITGLRETIPDVWIITLDSGQVWQMTRAQRYPLRIGLKVRLSSTRWGDSYRLTAPEHGGFVQVRRASE
jgi:hypothetical protein